MADTEELRVNVADIQVIADPSTVTTIYADGAQGFFASNNVAKFNLFEIVQDLGDPNPKNAMRKVVVARIAMSPQAAHDMARWILEQIKVEEQPAKDG